MKMLRSRLYGPVIPGGINSSRVKAVFIPPGEGIYWMGGNHYLPINLTFRFSIKAFVLSL